jgi:hypothetical protein
MSGAPSKAFSESLAKVHLDLPDSGDKSPAPAQDAAKAEKQAADATQPAEAKLSPEVIAQTTNAINKAIAAKAASAPASSLADVQSSLIASDNMTPPELIPAAEAEIPNEIELLKV